MSSSILAELGCKLPVGPLPDNLETETILESFQDVLSALTAATFAQDALWRDMFALTGSIRTFYGVHSVLEAWQACTRNANPEGFSYLKGSSRAVRLGASNWIQGEFSFTTQESPPRLCSARLSLVPAEGSQWVIWVLNTSLDQLQNHASVDSLAPAHQIQTHQGSNGRPPMNGHPEINGHADSNGHAESNGHIENGTDTAQNTFECVVVGAGQAGLSVAGRLQAQGIDYVLLEQNDVVGDNWKNRYRSTKLHTTRESCEFSSLFPSHHTQSEASWFNCEAAHLPFDRTFSPQYPQYLTKDDLARGYSEWAQKYAINVWVQATVKCGWWNDDAKNWTLQILQGTRKKTITTTHLVMCIGGGCQIPTMPRYPGMDKFHGEIQHSVDYTCPRDWQGKKGIVIGTANTAHDIAEDMQAANMALVTMIQRSPTYVLPAEYYGRIQDLTWNAEIPIEDADKATITSPLAVGRLTSMLVLNGMAKAEPERFDNLENAGFKVIRYGDIIYQVFDRFGGHYMDVGASAKIAKGLIKIKSDSLPTHFTKDGLVFGDGSELQADVVIFATGFVGNMKETVGQLLGSDVADRIEDFWGLDKEGEIKGAYRPCGHPNLWMGGGPCSHARYMSRYIALQIRAALDGTPLPVFV